MKSTNTINNNVTNNNGLVIGNGSSGAIVEEEFIRQLVNAPTGWGKVPVKQDTSWDSDRLSPDTYDPNTLGTHLWKSQNSLHSGSNSMSIKTNESSSLGNNNNYASLLSNNSTTGIPFNTHNNAIHNHNNNTNNNGMNMGMGNNNNNYSNAVTGGLHHHHPNKNLYENNNGGNGNLMYNNNNISNNNNNNSSTTNNNNNNNMGSQNFTSNPPTAVAQYPTNSNLYDNNNNNNCLNNNNNKVSPPNHLPSFNCFNNNNHNNVIGNNNTLNSTTPLGAPHNNNNNNNSFMIQHGGAGNKINSNQLLGSNKTFISSTNNNQHGSGNNEHDHFSGFSSPPSGTASISNFWNDTSSNFMGVTEESNTVNPFPSAAKVAAWNTQNNQFQQPSRSISGSGIGGMMNQPYRYPNGETPLLGSATGASSSSSNNLNVSAVCNGGMGNSSYISSTDNPNHSNNALNNYNASTNNNNNNNNLTNTNNHNNYDNDNNHFGFIGLGTGNGSQQQYQAQQQNPFPSSSNYKGLYGGSNKNPSLGNNNNNGGMMGAASNNKYYGIPNVAGSGATHNNYGGDEVGGGGGVSSSLGNGGNGSSQDDQDNDSDGGGIGVWKSVEAAKQETSMYWNPNLIDNMTPGESLSVLDMVPSPTSNNNNNVNNCNNQSSSMSNFHNNKGNQYHVPHHQQQQYQNKYGGAGVGTQGGGGGSNNNNNPSTYPNNNFTPSSGMMRTLSGAAVSSSDHDEGSSNGWGEPNLNSFTNDSNTVNNDSYYNNLNNAPNMLLPDPLYSQNNYNNALKHGKMKQSFNSTGSYGNDFGSGGIGNAGSAIQLSSVMGAAPPSIGTGNTLFNTNGDNRTPSSLEPLKGSNGGIVGGGGSSSFSSDIDNGTSIWARNIYNSEKTSSTLNSLGNLSLDDTVMNNSNLNKQIPGVLNCQFSNYNSFNTNLKTKSFNDNSNTNNNDTNRAFISNTLNNTNNNNNNTTNLNNYLMNKNNNYHNNNNNNTNDIINNYIVDNNNNNNNNGNNTDSLLYSKHHPSSSSRSISSPKSTNMSYTSLATSLPSSKLMPPPSNFVNSSSHQQNFNNNLLSGTNTQNMGGNNNNGDVFNTKFNDNIVAITNKIIHQLNNNNNGGSMTGMVVDTHSSMNNNNNNQQQLQQRSNFNSGNINVTDNATFGSIKDFHNPKTGISNNNNNQATTSSNNIINQQLDQLNQAINSGLIDPAILNLKLSPQILLMLTQLLNLHKTSQTLSSAIQQAQNASKNQQQSPHLANINSFSREQCDLLTIRYEQIKQQIIQLQTAITIAVNNTTSSMNPGSNMSSGSTMNNNNVNNNNNNVVNYNNALFNNNGNNNNNNTPGAAPVTGQKFTGESAATSVVNEDSLSSSNRDDPNENPSPSYSQKSRLMQWKLPSPPDDDNSKGVGASAAVYESGENASPNTFNEVDDVINKESGRNNEIENVEDKDKTLVDILPPSDNNAQNNNANTKFNQQHHQLFSGNSSNLNRSNLITAGTTNNSDVLKIAEFRPGKPWTGFKSTNVENDPYITPGSLASHTRNMIMHQNSCAVGGMLTSLNTASQQTKSIGSMFNDNGPVKDEFKKLNPIEEYLNNATKHIANGFPLNLNNKNFLTGVMGGFNEQLNTAAHHPQQLLPNPRFPNSGTNASNTNMLMPPFGVAGGKKLPPLLNPGGLIGGAGNNSNFLGSGPSNLVGSTPGANFLFNNGPPHGGNSVTNSTWKNSATLNAGNFNNVIGPASQSSHGFPSLLLPPPLNNNGVNSPFPPSGNLLNNNFNNPNLCPGGTNFTGFNGDNNNKTWLVLKNLTHQVEASALKTLCLQHGLVKKFYLNKPAGEALVLYSNQNEANRAFKVLDSLVLWNAPIKATLVNNILPQ